ncbi:uncharacterized protein LOC107429854 isoform X1 [Ziziphus jujuba]|uniref:Uncharacterized protein LOC107429854 isoform X1 n=1 Tax=Ziziphus jujuba TaxID=326968 RepID=A0ABM4AC39_ZIZJJ|nr:uncharacterized protein LOC107429854 isoform X1 [Ziziphus jujuba]
MVALFLKFLLGFSYRKKKNKSRVDENRCEAWPQVSTSFSLFLEKDLQRKESVEWVNMVLGRLWKVYRGGIANWIIGLLQSIIENLKKPDYVERVEIKQFSLGMSRCLLEILRDELLVVQMTCNVKSISVIVELPRMLLMLLLKFGTIPIVVPVGVRDFDIDEKVWVKLGLIPTEPFVGAVILSSFYS